MVTSTHPVTVAVRDTTQQIPIAYYRREGRRIPLLPQDVADSLDNGADPASKDEQAPRRVERPRTRQDIEARDLAAEFVEKFGIEARRLIEAVEANTLVRFYIFELTYTDNMEQQSPPSAA